VLISASLLGVVAILLWVVRRVSHVTYRAAGIKGKVGAGRYAATGVETAASRCAACRAAIVEEDSLFCPRCGVRLVTVATRDDGRCEPRS
jgi:uncharacterized paraquat-inducible protein A